MAAPNLASATTITGKTAGLNVTTSPVAIVSNVAASGKVYKVGTLVCSNVTGVSSADIVVDVYRGSSSYRLAYQTTIQAKGALTVISKNSPIYLEEGDSIRVSASANSSIDAVASYEIIG